MNKKEFSDLDPYAVLGVSADSSSKEIRKAFRKKALTFHPDKHGTSPKEIQMEAELEFKKVAWAYEILSSSKRERFYSSDHSYRENFDFSHFWEDWGSSEWAGFWGNDKDQEPISEENQEEIKKMWEEEDELSEQERLERARVEVISLQNVSCWREYYENKASVLPSSGVGRERPPINQQFNSIVSLWKGSLVNLHVDAIVNAANTMLAGGGGLDGAIHRAAGEKLYDECDLLGSCQTGNVAITRGYLLPAKYIIHACGPIGQRPQKLSSCYSRALEVAVEHNIRTIAFPCISTGTYGYPIESATNVALHTVRDWLAKEDNASKIDRIIFSCFRGIELQIYEKWMQWYFPMGEEDIHSLPETQHLLKPSIEAILFESEEN